LWKYRLKMRTFVELERIIWRTSKVFIFGNPYNTVVATKPEAASAPGRLSHPQKHWVALPRLIAKTTLRSIRPRADIT
jgi:hypothetical protein